MAISVKELKGMTPQLVENVAQRGIANSEQLLEAAKAPAGRKALAEQLGAKERDILELANRADLSRVKGVAGVFSDLLEKVGVDTVKELATRRPDSLHAKINELNDKEKLAKRAPSEADVQDWVAQAKQLPKILSH
jgi:predicted flap endonuclease-1-like 5' DNA nuclease